MLAALAASEIPPKQIAIISFHEDTIAEVERLAPQLRTHWLSGYKQDDTGQLWPTADQVVATVERIHADGFGSEANTAQFDQVFIKTWPCRTIVVFSAFYRVGGNGPAFHYAKERIDGSKEGVLSGHELESV